MHDNYEHRLIHFKAKKGASTDAKQSESVNAGGASTSTMAKEMQTTASGYDGSGVAATHAEEGPYKEEKDAKSNESKLHKLKDKLFKH
jgi:cellobiose-specific phosphotransferase system component IIB